MVVTDHLFFGRSGPMTIETAVEFDELVLYTACPLCGCPEMSFLLSQSCTEHPSYRPVFSPQLHWQTCDHCGHVFRNGYYTDEAAALMFDDPSSGLEVAADFELQRLVSARMIDRVLPLRSGGSWLDVGFGAGNLLFTAAEYGFRAIGCDLRRQGVEQIRQLGIEAYCCDVSELEFDEQVSVVSMADVLEHVPYPVSTLRAVHRILEPGGALLVSMPNFDTTVWRVLDMLGVNPYWGEVEHLHNFSRTRLYELLLATGFEPVSYGVSERYRTCMEVLARRV
jgi:2-polyprenyl-3-methyl-5-hydroxy-6-metoxy-1,4-benzoquinol methylase